MTSYSTNEIRTFLQSELDRRGCNKRELSDAMGMNPGYVAQVLNPNATNGISSPTRHRISLWIDKVMALWPNLTAAERAMLRDLP